MKTLLEKKIFSEKKEFRLSTLGDDLTKRWYVSYYVHIGYSRFLRKAYGGINRYKTVAERKKAAALLIDQLSKEDAAKASLSTSKIRADIFKQLDLLKQKLNPKTITTYKTKLEHFTRHLAAIGVYDWKELESWHIRNYFNTLNTVSNTTFNSYLQTVGTIMRYLVKNEFIKKNPMPQIDFLKETKNPKKYFKSNDIAILKPDLQKDPIQWMAAQLLCYCFIRPKEMRLLKISDVDMDLAVITVRGEISKNGKTQTVAIPDCFLEAVIQWIQGVPSSYYFLSRSTKLLSRDYISKGHRKILDRMGYHDAYSLYSWKHTGAVLAARSGINLKDLQAQIRHHSLDELYGYLRQMGVIDSVDVRCKMPAL